MNRQGDNEPLIQFDTIKRLRQLALRIHRQLEIQCNGSKYEYRANMNYDAWLNQAQSDVVKSIRADEKCRDEIVRICAENDLFFYIQEDPRGGTLYISKEKLTDQNYTNGVFIA